MLCLASAGTEGASFLEIPVGAEAAALGGAYSALATNAYAPIYNPAGLAFSPSSQLAAQHLSYLESIHYEYLGFVLPLSTQQSAIGTSVQYLGSGDFTQTNDSGQQIGEFSSHFAAYTLSYGQKVNDELAFGISAKLINAKISDVNANAYAADAGMMMRASEKITLAGVMSNAGTQLNFLNDGGSLPLAGRLGGAYEFSPQWRGSVDGIYRAYGLFSAHVGLEARPISFLSLRAGYRTDTTKELGPLAGLTAGMGLTLWGQDFSYAWLPMSDLGMTQYFSILLKFGEDNKGKRNLIRYGNMRTVHLKINNQSIEGYVIQDPETGLRNSPDPDFAELIQLLTGEDITLSARGSSSSGNQP